MGLADKRRQIARIWLMLIAGLLVSNLLMRCTDMFRSDIVPPVVFIINPKDTSQDLSGVVPVQTKAYDSSSITYLDFFIDGVQVARVTKKPYTYYWNTNFWSQSVAHQIYVKAADEYGNIATSDPIVVNLNPDHLSGPQPVYPEPYALLSSENLTLLWKSQQGATAYRLEFSLDPGMSNIVSGYTLQDTALALTLDRNRYFWRVRAELTARQNSICFSTAYSPVQCFFTGERIFVLQSGGAGDEYGEELVELPDSSYRIIGTKLMNVKDRIRSRLLVIDVDLLGRQKAIYEMPYFQKSYASVQNNMNTIIAGLDISEQAIWIALDTAGIVQWKTIIGGKSVAKTLLRGSSGRLYSVIERHYSADSVYVDWVRLSDVGLIEFQRTLFKHHSNSGIRWSSLQSGFTGSYWLLGDSNGELILYLIDESVQIQLTRTFSGERYLTAVAILESGTGGICIFANAGVGDACDGMVIWVDNDGNELRRWLFGDIGADRIQSVKKTNEGAYILTGSTKSGSYGISDIWIVKLNADGTELWSRNYGKTMTNSGAAVIQTFDGGYAVAGTLDRYTGRINKDVIIIKTDRDGQTVRNWFHE